MWKLAATGAVLLVAGAVRFSYFLNRTPTLEDYLAFRCGPSEAARLGVPGGHWLSAWAHCWGCPAMAAGAALLMLACVLALRQRAAGVYQRG